MMLDENPYAAPQVTPERPLSTQPASVWHNRLGALGFLFSLTFPLIALISLGALFMEDDFGIVRWRVHRLIRLALFRTSIVSLPAVAISLIGLAHSPRRLAFYGLFVGLLGSAYWLLSILDVFRH